MFAYDSFMRGIFGRDDGFHYSRCIFGNARLTHADDATGTLIVVLLMGPSDQTQGTPAA